MFALSLPVLIALVSFGLGIVRFIWTTFFSKNARVEAAHDWLVQKRTELKAERDRLKATYDRIKKEPPSTGQDVVDKLNSQFGGEKKD